MRLLDLCCKAGGAGMGYHLAGFKVTGIDIEPQARYPFEFHQADALEFLREHGQRFDAIHASPPCQLWAKGHNPNREKYPDLISPLREQFIALGKPYVIENVVDAPLIDPITICGGGLGLKVGNMQLHRHRNFESNMPLVGVECKKIAPYTLTVTGNGTPTGSYEKLGSVDTDTVRSLMGMIWATRKECSQAVPPAYTKFIGLQLMELLRRTA